MSGRTSIASVASPSTTAAPHGFVGLAMPRSPTAKRLFGLFDARQVSIWRGQEFSHALLARVTQKNEAELDPALDRLVQAGQLLRHGVALRPPMSSNMRFVRTSPTARC